ncbi:MAG: hypothetical protein K2M82_00120, partial [Lachnospiraceae bacterium]|nr:hypothetical protein [Lachnospiraceae bacterium]
MPKSTPCTDIPEINLPFGDFSSEFDCWVSTKTSVSGGSNKPSDADETTTPTESTINAAATGITGLISFLFFSILIYFSSDSSGTATSKS